MVDAAKPNTGEYSLMSNCICLWGPVRRTQLDAFIPLGTGGLEISHIRLSQLLINNVKVKWCLTIGFFLD